MTEKLINGFKSINIDIDGKTAEKFIIYMRELVSWNEKVNLTAITEPNEIITKHFLDSAAPAEYIGEGASVIDVGCGAGFPGLVLKLLRNDINLTLLDSLDKRLKFLDFVINETETEGIALLHMRAEDGGRDRKYREKFDVAVSRAVANMAVLCEYCLPFVKTGGKLIALKGPKTAEELKNAETAIKRLGGRLAGVYESKIPYTDLEHTVVIIEKIGKTPAEYPRKAGTPSKKPIK